MNQLGEFFSIALLCLTMGMVSCTSTVSVQGKQATSDEVLNYSDSVSSYDSTAVQRALEHSVEEKLLPKHKVRK